MFSNDRSAKGLVPGLHKRKTKYTTTIQPRSFIPGHLSQRNEDVFTSKTCAQKCLAALFITATNCKPPRCPLTSKQLNKQGPMLWNSPQGWGGRNPDTHDSPEEPPEDFGECKQPSPPGYELCDVTYLTKFETSSGLRREWGWGCGWWRVGEVTEGLQEGLCGGGRVCLVSVLQR